ncbi:potassium channel subfamily K member 18 [Callorhinchus milii]|uniref:potassium channel subfamily K member 18 n=1 Tax=Callorhinchus milii TaxID=7868 RepID=UPI0004571845|nr:potassium channel subfamily K member 18 [Callorhinchus milii]|eukprot:gi/632970766/ref/XP_007901830.1/ PREDICTED: potassium channel subfamily K member 18 [Callorhinchus milii]
MSSQDVPSPAVKCKRRCVKVLRAIFPHLFLVSLLVTYAVVGAFIFQQLESGIKETEDYDQFLNRLWNITLTSESSKGNKTAKMFFKERVKMEMENFQSHWLIRKSNWTFLGSLFFSCTVFTTVGYGHIYPITTAGKIVCMFYAMFGIPVMLLVITDVGDMLAALLSRAYNKIRKLLLKNAVTPPPSATPSRWSSFKQSLTSQRSTSSFKKGPHVILTPMGPVNITKVLNTQSSVKSKSERLRHTEIFEKIIMKENFNSEVFRENRRDRSKSCPQLDVKSLEDNSGFQSLGCELEKLDVPIILILVIVITYILFSAAMLSIWENWDYLDSFYFYFITITTIGFGDFVPEHPNFFMITSVLIITGMTIMSMAFKLAQNRIVHCYKEAMKWIHSSKRIKYKVI